MSEHTPKGTQPLPDPPAHRSGQTTPEKDEGPTFKEPHERDESADSQVRPSDELMKQAARDVQDGLVDTSKAEATDSTYARSLRSEPQADEAHAGSEARPTDSFGNRG